MDLMTTLYLTFGLGAALGGFACIALTIGIRKTLDLGKSWVIFVPSTPGAYAQVLRRRLRKGETDIKIKGSDERERIICSPKGAYPTNKGPLHLIGESTGWNLVAPSKEDRPAGVTDDEYQAMRVCDPKIYWRATRENDMEDFYAAQQNKDPWQKAAIMPALFVSLGLLVILGIVMWKFVPGFGGG